MSRNSSTSSRRVPLLEAPQVVGRALRLVVATEDGQRIVYVPISRTHGHKDNYVLVENWLADKEGLPNE